VQIDRRSGIKLSEAYTNCSASDLSVACASCDCLDPFDHHLLELAQAEPAGQILPHRRIAGGSKEKALNTSDFAYVSTGDNHDPIRLSKRLNPKGNDFAPIGAWN